MFAYLDGGSVSMLVGAVAAGAAGVGVAMKSKLGMFRSGKDKGGNESSADGTDQTNVDADDTTTSETLDADT